MARFDKVEPRAGSFRAKLNFALVSADVGKTIGVSINTSGRVVRGGTAVADIVGVIVPVRTMDVAEPIDVMTAGEVVEVTPTAGGNFAAGDRVYADTAAGAISTTNTGKLLGRIIEPGRLVVRTALA